MTIGATQGRVAKTTHNSKLFIPVPDTTFRAFLEEIDTLYGKHPEIGMAIEKDLDVHAQKKKQLRLEDKLFYKNQVGSLPGVDIGDSIIKAEDLLLGIGRPRMEAYWVYIFLMIRGYLGSLSSKEARLFLRESMSLYAFMEGRGNQLPGITTIVENVNSVSNFTRDLIFNKQIEAILDESLDDFRNILIDSTSVAANSAWPTDAKILLGLGARAYRLGQKLELFGIENMRVVRVEDWLKEMDTLVFKIALVSGKAQSRGNVKKYYRRLLRRGKKVLEHIDKKLGLIEETYAPYPFLAPSRIVLLERILGQIQQDIADGYKVIGYAEDRVFHGKQIASTEKVLSLSDGSASFIKKGGSDPVIGYKPQVARSGNGFVVSVIVPEGNAADSIELVPVTLDIVNRTGAVPEVVSTDDGYASKEGRDELRNLGVEVVSINGSKGKKLTDEEDWYSETYRTARNGRSAVESLIYTLKYVFDFGKVRRRGIEAVRAELLEKALAYNCCRMIAVRNAHKRRWPQAA